MNYVAEDRIIGAAERVVGRANGLPASANGERVGFWVRAGALALLTELQIDLTDYTEPEPEAEPPTERRPSQPWLDGDLELDLDACPETERAT